jgi:hypothetical protein
MKHYTIGAKMAYGDISPVYADNQHGEWVKAKDMDKAINKLKLKLITVKKAVFTQSKLLDNCASNFKSKTISDIASSLRSIKF